MIINPPLLATPNYDEFSRISGELTEPSTQAEYKVRYRSLVRRPSHRPVTAFIILGDIAFGVVFFLWLISPEHYPQPGSTAVVTVARTFAVISIGIIECFRVINVTTLCLATLLARDPIPVRPERKTRVAFLTTIVPSEEPLDMVERTLRAALCIRHDGTFHVWLLDEGDDPEVRKMCERLGVRHFSRRGVLAWNMPTGPYKTKTKHGNYNAWLISHHQEYDYFASVDPDHVPLSNFCERLLGYFRDPDVAFVVGPQVYGNFDTFVTRAAESQQYLFHSLLQRAANAFRCAMLVGTNNAVRISAIMSIGGVRDSITEDMATSLAFHAHRNSKTGRRWQSVYTPDVLAVGEGPSTWTDYYTQQYRWSRGTDEVLVRTFWRLARRLRPGQLLHYALMMSYYPTTAISWILGIYSVLIYLLFGVSGLSVGYDTWIVLYSNAVAFQLALYFWNRRHNVSPHEEEGSSGISGMFISLLSTPIYVASLIGAILARKSQFVVTPKGDSMNRDRCRTFRLHYFWALLIGSALVMSAFLGHGNPVMRVWALLMVVIALLPSLIWLAVGRRKQWWTESGQSRPASPSVTLSLEEVA